jgi:hypothetical protein
MLKLFAKLSLVLITLPISGIAIRPLLTLLPVQAGLEQVQSPKDNQELKSLCAQDQSDRTPAKGKPIDWANVGPHDQARLKRVKEFYRQNLLKTANDYDCAATVLQHGQAPEDFLLAHEFWVVAISMGKNDRETLAMAASSEDRFLMNIGRPQRFGTQARSVDNGPVTLYPVDEAVTDELRRVMGTHSLAEIKAHLAEMNKK